MTEKNDIFFIEYYFVRPEHVRACNELAGIILTSVVNEVGCLMGVVMTTALCRVRHRIPKHWLITLLTRYTYILLLFLYILLLRFYSYFTLK